MRAAFGKYRRTLSIISVPHKNHGRLEASRRLAENSFAEQEDVSQNSCPRVSSEQSILLCTPPIYIFAKASAETRTTQNSPEECMESHLLAALQAHPLQSQWKPGRYCNGNLSTPLRANLCRHRGVAHRHKATPRWLEERGGGTRHTIAHQKMGILRLCARVTEGMIVLQLQISLPGGEHARIYLQGGDRLLPNIERIDSLRPGSAALYGKRTTFVVV
jgi:hypothetical protein